MYDTATRQDFWIIEGYDVLIDLAERVFEICLRRPIDELLPYLASRAQTNWEYRLPEPLAVQFVMRSTDGPEVAQDVSLTFLKLRGLKGQIAFRGGTSSENEFSGWWSLKNHDGLITLPPYP